MQNQEKRRLTYSLIIKSIGVALLILVLRKIQWTDLLATIKHVHPLSLTGAVLALCIVYVVKSCRWHVLVQSTGVSPRLRDSWKLFHIGFFLGNITPGNLGELGRAAYLKSLGVPYRTGVAIGFVDRLADLAVMGVIGLISLGVLFGNIGWLIAVIGFAVGSLVAALILSQRKAAYRIEWLTFLETLMNRYVIGPLLLLTICNWLLYFVWTILLARSLGISVPALPLAAALTVTGIVTFLPVSPAGLGTREVALITLLAPYGIRPAQSVAMGLLMFALIMGTSLLGGFYWMTGTTLRQKKSTSFDV